MYLLHLLSDHNDSELVMSALKVKTLMSLKAVMGVLWSVLRSCLLDFGDVLNNCRENKSLTVPESIHQGFIPKKEQHETGNN